jgi:hypothetical protein
VIHKVPRAIHTAPVRGIAALASETREPATVRSTGHARRGSGGVRSIKCTVWEKRSAGTGVGGTCSSSLMAPDHGLVPIRLTNSEERSCPQKSADLAPSDFFLFGYVKGKLMRCHAEIPYELLVRIQVILAEIPRETLNAVFLEWMERLQKCV